jgi:hypothetical protein
MIGQVNITIDQSTDEIAGYNNINYKQLSSITNGYVESIIFTTIDKLDPKDRNGILVECLKKLTPGAQLTVRFLNLVLLANRVKASYIDGDKFADIIKNLNSFWTESDFMGLISSMSDFKLIKLVNEDLNLVAVIEKNK